ncbi:MAG: hypothetical protein JXA18_15410 [Chitinispirillaceae bacterium]|nr:hypothetical protein [Chitinispirillaceae bacterium]
MNKTMILALCAMAAFSSAEKNKTAPPVDRLHGTWCTGEEGMVLRFSTGDSLFVTSTSDETIQGVGKYQRTDSTFTATLLNDEVTLTMRYLYRWKGADTVEAKATFFTINDEAVEHPQEWMSMVRCDRKGTKD